MIARAGSSSMVSHAPGIRPALEQELVDHGRNIDFVLYLRVPDDVLLRRLQAGKLANLRVYL